MNDMQKSLYRRSVCWKVGKIIAADFAGAMLITLHCSSPVVMPPELAKQVYRTWRATAQRIVGSPFNCLRIIDYGPHPTPEVVFHVVADLPQDLCMKACGAWYMGKATVAPLDEKAFDRITGCIMHQDSKPKAQLWSYCRGTARPPRCSA